MKANNTQVFGFASNIMLTPHRQPTLQKLRLWAVLRFLQFKTILQMTSVTDWARLKTFRTSSGDFLLRDAKCYWCTVYCHFHPSSLDYEFLVSTAHVYYINLFSQPVRAAVLKKPVKKQEHWIHHYHTWHARTDYSNWASPGTGTIILTNKFNTGL